MSLPRDLTILIDSREKKPLPFPEHLVVCDPAPRTLRVRHACITLKTGDYALGGYPECGVVERKGSLREVATNMQSGDLLRQSGVLRRLAELPRAALLLEGPIHPMTPTPECEHPGAGISSLLALCPRLSLMVLPATTPLQRLACGEWVIRWLLAGLPPC